MFLFIFVIAFVGYLLVRGYAPDILGLEKFMDFGFIKSYLANGGFPGKDMWWAGANINYYSFGHMVAAWIIAILRLPAGVGYNVILALIFGVSCGLCYWIVKLLIGEKSRWRGVMAGLIGTFLVMLGGNSHSLWYLAMNKSLTNYWYADATRFVYNTIHEFPSYSFVVSDLHGHVLDLPFVLLFIGLLIKWSKKSSWWLCGLLGTLLGIMMMTNTWDTLIYGFLLIVTAFWLLISKKRSVMELVREGLIMIFLTAASSLPWWINFHSISEGIRLVKDRTPLWQLGVLWGGHLMIVFMAMIRNIKKGTPRNGVVLALSLTAAMMLVLPEVIYFKDIYPNHPRANTMFKFTYQGFIMMGLIGGWLSYQLMEMRACLIKGMMVSMLLILLYGFGIFPYKAFNNFYSDFKVYKGVDGLAWVKTKYPDDWEIIKYLEKNRDGKNMVESVGDSYTEYNFISAFSGTPTIVGWRVHEWLWRGSYDVIKQREMEVKSFYETKDQNERKRIIEKYNLGWVVIGSRESKDYVINRDEIKKVADEVLLSGEEELWKIR